MRIGTMLAASRGAFYIVPAGASSDVDDYGGVYDKSTLEKKARVETIEYAIEH